MLTPNGTSGSAALACHAPDNAMIKAVARAFRWREMLENGTHATITDLARAEHIDHSYVGRILRLTLLAPDIVEAIVTHGASETLTLAVLSQAFPMEWKQQRDALR